MIFLEGRFQDESTELKFRDSKVMRGNSLTKREKVMKLSKIYLIYESKLKSNDIGQRIRRKTCNTTQNCAQNDPINHRIKAIHSNF